MSDAVEVLVLGNQICKILPGHTHCVGTPQQRSWQWTNPAGLWEIQLTNGLPGPVITATGPDFNLCFPGPHPADVVGTLRRILVLVDGLEGDSDG